MAMLIGYARVSTDDQILDRQIDALVAAGVAPHCIYSETITTDASRRRTKDKDGASPYPPQLRRALAALRPGDTLVAISLDRLTRDGPLSAFVLIDEIAKKGCGVRILDLQIDTLDPMGQMLLGVVAYVARIERDNLRKRTIQGLAAAKKRGKILGRPRRVSGAMALRDLVDLAVRLRGDGLSLRRIAHAAGIGDATLRRYLALADAEGMLPAGWLDDVAATAPTAAVAAAGSRSKKKKTSTV